MSSRERWLVAVLGVMTALGLSMCRAFAANAPPALIPEPQQLTMTSGCRLVLSEQRPLTIPPTIDPGGLDLLTDRLQALRLPVPAISSVPIISVRRFRGPAERYTLDITSRAIRIAAGGSAGEMDALATLAQLVGQDGARQSAPCVRIKDEPALAWRFLSDDVSRGPLPTMAYFASRIRRLAGYKLNGYSIYLENVVVRAGHEGETRADAITKAELARLAQLCARYHMAFVPEQESFAHLGALLASERYRDVRENDFGDLISPAAPQTYAVLRDLFSSEFSGVPGLRLIHIGGDETSELGSGRSAALVKRRGYATVYAAHVSRVAQIVKALGARPMMWGDAIKQYPQILRAIPKAMIVVPFDYDVETSYDPLIAPIQRAGFAQLVAPSVANFNRFFPDLPRATENIGAFVAAAKRHQVLGMFVTVWIGARDELYDATWYPVAFAAAHAWEKVNEPASAFCPRFAQLTFGTARACAPFLDFARLDIDFRRDFPFDTPETLWRADWRVPYLAKRLKLTPGQFAQIAHHITALRTDVAALGVKRDVHLVDAMRLAALRYSILLPLLEGARPNRTVVERAERMHLAEWTYENRRFSATDQITSRYAAFLPIERSTFQTASLLPTIANAPASAEVQAVQSWLVEHEPLAADPSFLLRDPVPYVADATGIDPRATATILPRIAALGSIPADPAVRVAERYLSAELDRATMPFVIKHEYNDLLAVTKGSNAASTQLPIAHVTAALTLYESTLSALHDAYATLDDRSANVLGALDQQRQLVRNMEDCFQTFVHEWLTYGGGPQSAKDDPRAHLPKSPRAAFCEP